MQFIHNLLVLILSTITLVLANHHHGQHPFVTPDESGSDPYTGLKMSSSSKSLNVFKKPLALHSTSPMTGFLRNGYCEVPASDFGNHGVAAEVTEEFLDFSASRGNDLRPVGLKGGCKWCLCASRWLEAFDARGQQGDKVVPKIFLNATNESALKKIKMEDLKAFAVDKEQ